MSMMNKMEHFDLTSLLTPPKRRLEREETLPFAVTVHLEIPAVVVVVVVEHCFHEFVRAALLIQRKT